ncbi:MAG: methionyl-tRNA formyltransferase [Bacteroidetes bacterium]|nr:methionyl-tRNA formyltransferase [Bacteroidota bacterium]
MTDLRIVFMGTPEFAVASLDILVQNNYNIVGVITVPDKPAGRGQQLQQSAVKKYALEKGLHILQPEKLKAEEFLNELRALKADLQIVVAFRMLPEVVWSMPRLGTFNLHGSLLPQYRGAAPINWAVMNGDKETGVSTFFLQQEIDTGKIIFREKTAIGENETAGEVHDRLMNIGASLVLKTVQAIEQNNYPQVDQSELIAQGEQVKHAPKIFKEDCRINWQDTVDRIHNQVRGLSPYPAAYTELISTDDKPVSMKVFHTEKESGSHGQPVGSILSDSKTYLKVAAKDGFIKITELQLAGKKRMPVSEFLRGFQIGKGWKAL